MSSIGVGIITLSQILVLVTMNALLAERAISQRPGSIARPNLTGKWTLDKSKSSKEVAADIVVMIIHNEPEIRMTRMATIEKQTRVDHFTFYSDGRGETNPILGQKDPAPTKTKWEGRRLVIRSSSPMVLPDGSRPGINFQRTEKWQISKDDLLQWTTAFTVNGSFDPRNTGGLFGPIQKDIKRVFRRNLP